MFFEFLYKRKKKKKMDTRLLYTLDNSWPGIGKRHRLHVLNKLHKRTELKWIVLKLMFLIINTLL